MDKDLTSYVKVYNNWFDKEKCVETIRDIQNKEWHRHEFHYPSENTFITINGEKELDITNDSCSTSDFRGKIHNGFLGLVMELIPKIMLDIPSPPCIIYT